MLRRRRPEGEVHWAHFHDGYPVCWGYDRDGQFLATNVESDVTCPECQAFLRENPVVGG